jgi:hypothetical protein
VGSAVSGVMKQKAVRKRSSECFILIRKYRFLAGNEAAEQETWRSRRGYRLERGMIRERLENITRPRSQESLRMNR